MSSHTLSSSQTLGPFFHDGMLRADARRTVLAAPETVGERIRIAGYVYDGAGLGVPDAMIEIWQANHYGRYNHPTDQRELPLDPTFHGFGRCATDAAGGYCFETIKPGRVPFDDPRLQAPHICVAVFARGLLNHLLTRLYFEDEPTNADDPVLQFVPASRQATLLARRAAAEHGAMLYHFEIVLQGAGETVFFNL
ncbi:MAG: protocatechuate 3,4-dioxygenase subunit alpha [Chloroflexota bacterium]|nr:protocatechuate 3,4-dioxygenase subunit alpha [Chloroflexota bacterium]